MLLANWVFLRGVCHTQPRGRDKSGPYDIASLVFFGAIRRQYHPGVMHRFASGLAPTRAHPPPTSPRATTFRLALLPPDMLAAPSSGDGGGSPTCSGTGWFGECEGPLWVPCLTARCSMHGCPKTVGDRELGRATRSGTAPPLGAINRAPTTHSFAFSHNLLLG
jgi:hypothetical protein